LSAATEGEDNGGGSPLVPILIGILVLAGISVVAFTILQRRRRGATPGAPASSKAG
jgi:hypothetical protein